MANDPYTRLYWRFVEEYPDIYNDDRAWAAWTRLLQQADMAWPAPAALPRWLRSNVLAKLETAELVSVSTDGNHYRIRGMAAERRRRSDHARHAARERWSNADGNPPSNAGGNAQTMPRRDETRKDETSNGAKPLEIDSLNYDPESYEALVRDKLARRLT
jgi:hypothetical protein